MNEGATVLVVEDDGPLRSFLRTALGAHGYRVLEAQTLVPQIRDDDWLPFGGQHQVSYDVRSRAGTTARRLKGCRKRWTFEMESS